MTDTQTKTAGLSLKGKLAGLPSQPGVYLFKDSRAKVIYIGKAKSLRGRVKNYFRKAGADDPKTAALVSRIADLELIVTDSEVEALILEANLIKEHTPRFNIMLKDDKHFPYIKVTTNEPFPRVLVTRRIEKDGARYFGPYTSSASMRKTLRFITQLFKIRSCSLTIPHPKGQKYRVCLDYHIGRCGGPCENFQSQEEYRELVDGVLLFLGGRAKQLSADLEQKMKEAAAKSEFEHAAELRDRINDLKSVTDRQKVDVAEKVDRDVIALAQDEGVGVAVVLQIREGILIGRQDIQLKPGELASEESVLREFLEQYYNHQPNLPAEVYVARKVEDESALADWLSDMRGKKVKIISPQRGEKLRLVGMAEANAKLLLGELLTQRRGYRERIAPMVATLQKALSLAEAPNLLCCFDVSNTGATDAVGAMSYFKKGRPFKGEYRRFKIKSVSGQDDYAMIREIVGRYFFRRLDEKKPLPNLVVIDGGRGQLNAALAELKSLGLHDQPIIGLAKRLEEIYLADHAEPITLNKSSPALLLLKQVRDEAHRFGVTYNRKVRTKRTIISQLDGIPGVGPSRRQALLKKFGSVKKIKDASLDQIADTPGISRKLAESVKSSL